MDSFSIEAIVSEVAERLSGARVDKVHQPGPEDLILRAWNGREELRFLFSLKPGLPRCHLTSLPAANPPAPPRFCQLLRARIGRLVEIERVAGERIVRIYCRGRGGEDYLLVAELFGSHPDLLLLDGDGKIIDALRRSTAGGRELLPGRPYHSPAAAPGRFSLSGPLPEVPEEARLPPGFERWLRQFSPMSPLMARDLASGVAAGAEPAAVLQELRQAWLARDFRPSVVFFVDRPLLTAFPLRFLQPDSLQEFSSMSEAADFFYSLPQAAGRDPGRKELRNIIKRERQRLETRLLRMEKQGEGLAEAETGCRLGELLLANLHRVRRGMAEITLEDVFRQPPEPVSIPLDPRLSPQENAEQLFRSYRKGRRGEEHLQRRLVETRDEMYWLEGAALALEEAESPEDIGEIRSELADGGLLPHPRIPDRRRRQPAATGGISRAVTPGGYEIIWGKSNRGNDRVSRDLMGPDDLWFHANRLPGCHLVLKRGNRSGEIPETDQLFAAAVAAGYSRGKEADKVEVMVTEGKHVRRPKGARPGLVRVDRYRTMMVRPQRPERGEGTG